MQKKIILPLLVSLTLFINPEIYAAYSGTCTIYIKSSVGEGLVIKYDLLDGTTISNTCFNNLDLLNGQTCTILVASDSKIKLTAYPHNYAGGSSLIKAGNEYLTITCGNTNSNLSGTITYKNGCLATTATSSGNNAYFKTTCTDVDSGITVSGSICKNTVDYYEMQLANCG